MQTNLTEKVKFLIETAKIGSSKDFTADEKQRVFSHFESFGLNPATCRSRFFRDGWRTWELNGIIGCIINAASHDAALSADLEPLAGIVAEAESVTLDTPVSDIQDIVYRFYDELDPKVNFINYLGQLGLSDTSARQHLRNPQNFHPWELFGIRKIFDSFME